MGCQEKNQDYKVPFVVLFFMFKVVVVGCL